MREEYEKNAFDVLKYIAAVFVMCKHYGRHAMVLLRQLEPHVQETYRTAGLFFEWMVRAAEFFEPVPVFFAVSGFLTAASCGRSSSAGEFIKKRLRRVYPPLWICTAVYLAVLALTVRDRLDRSILPWLLTQAIGLANTPSCLKNYATGSVNGALWMIFALIQMYVLLAVLYSHIRNWKMRQWSCAMAACILANVLSRVLVNRIGTDSAAAKLLERSFVPFLLWYAIGVLAYCKRNEMIPFCRTYGWRIAAGIIGVNLIIKLSGILILTDVGYYCGLIEGILAACIAIVLAFRLPAVRARRDVTYELFLYHWMILNLFVGYHWVWTGGVWWVPPLLFIGFLTAAFGTASAMYLLTGKMLSFRVTKGLSKGQSL